jgi:hypothetical protein
MAAEKQDGVEPTPALNPEVEKPSDIQLERDTELAPATTMPAIDPVIEKRVLRKFDRRVPIITGFMCKTCCIILFLVRLRC